MKILFAASECMPFVKSGGLADVIFALPKSLKKNGIDARVMLPLYGQIPAEFKAKMQFKKAITTKMGWREAYCGLFELTHDEVVYYFIDHEYYFKRDSLYGHYDDGERFAYFCRATLDIIPYLNFIPDIIHSHDWHTGMIGFLLKEQYRHLPLYQPIKSVFTIHNLQFQGIFPRSLMHDLLMFDDHYFHVDRLEFYGNINFLKAGLIAADKITTVSKTYKNEIQEPFFGYQLDGLLRALDYRMVGILNGIDPTVYNPEIDPNLAVNYNLQTLEKKKTNKRILQTGLGLLVSETVPVVAMITRLSKQKGIDLVQRVFDEMMQENVQFIIIGSGDEHYESFFSHMEAIYPDKVRVHLGLNESLAHRVYAGADLFLMPSLFEPCGLSQLIALAYGTIPLVRQTGGLSDTVQNYDETNPAGNGFTFPNYNAHDLLFTYQRALNLYKSSQWQTLVERAMSSDYSWTQSANQYQQVYQELMQN